MGETYMVPNVPYESQKTSAECWLASYKMMLGWKKRDTSKAEKLPNDAEMRERGIYDSEFRDCRDAIGLTSTDFGYFQDEDNILGCLKSFGPIWCSGYWAQGHKHILVLVGIEIHWYGTTVYVNDPQRGFAGLPGGPVEWKLDRFVGKQNKVPHAFQHWR